MTLKKAEYIAKCGEEEYNRMREKQNERQRKEEYIARHGEEAWQKQLEKRRVNRKQDDEAYKRELQKNREWRRKNPEKTKAIEHKKNRKGGERYKQKVKYMTTGLQGAKNKIRGKHQRQYKPFKDIIAPESQIHHEWIPKTAKYRGVALVEAKPHRYGIIDVIQILDGKITVLTEEEVKNEGRKKDEK